MTRGRHNLCVYVAALAAAGTLLAGCSDDATPEADPSPTAADSPSETPGESGSESPSVEPATGKRLATRTFTTRAPQGWTVRAGSSTKLYATMYAAEENADGSVGGFLSIVDGDALADSSLDELARELVRSSEFKAGKRPEIQPTTEIAGVEAYHVTGKLGDSTNIIQIGTIHDNQLVEIRLESHDRTPEELQEVLDSVVAAWQWA